MILDIEHRLEFRYGAYISESTMELRTEPQSNAHQTVRSFYLAVGPVTKVFRYINWNGVAVHHFSIVDYHKDIKVIARSVVETHPQHPFLEEMEDSLGDYGPLGPLLDYVNFDGPVVKSAALEEASRPLPAEGTLGERVRATINLVAKLIKYQSSVTTYLSTSDAALEKGMGVCQDFAHVTLAMLRLQGIPCRYVSGYLHIPITEDRPTAESHAWIEVYSPSKGWVAFDPTHGIKPDERYVSVGVGRHYDDVAPNRGIYVGNAGEMLVATVRTRETDRDAIVDLREEIGKIEVPVYAEIPRPVRTPADMAALMAQQHQQQQQQ